jgi:hypothetical protein
MSSFRFRTRPICGGFVGGTSPLLVLSNISISAKIDCNEKRIVQPQAKGTHRQKPSIKPETCAM